MLTPVRRRIMQLRKQATAWFEDFKIKTMLKPYLIFRPRLHSLSILSTCTATELCETYRRITRNVSKQYRYPSLRNQNVTDGRTT